MERSTLFRYIKLSKKYYLYKSYKTIFSRTTSVIYINIDGEQHRVELASTSSAAELRSKLSERYGVSAITCFLDSTGNRLHTNDEKSVSVGELLTENNSVQLITDEKKSAGISILNRKNQLSERQTDFNYIQLLNQLRKATSRGLRLASSTNKVITAIDLNYNMWEIIFHNCNLFRGIRMDKNSPERAFKYLFKFKESNDNFPLFRVHDDTYSRIYLKDREIHSSFLSSRFFDDGIDSNPLIGFGINGKYFKNRTKPNMHKSVYLTHCLSFPRVTVELDASYLEPTKQFIEDINIVLSICVKDQQIIKLKEGAHLYHTEKHDNKQTAEEATKQINIETSFTASLISSFNFRASYSTEKDSDKKTSMQTPLLKFEAVGGDTRFTPEPARWIETVNNPFLWRIIEQDDYESVITLLDQEQRQKLHEIICSRNTTNNTLNNDTKWRQFGITVAGGHQSGKKLDQLSFPYGLFTNKDDKIYIADYENQRIIEWKPHAANGRVVAGGNGQGKDINQLHEPKDVIFNKRDNSFIISDTGNRRVVRWFHQNREGQIIIANIDCNCLAMDKYGYFYVSDNQKHEVRKWKIGDTRDGIVVAGGNGKGEKFNQLDCPSFMFVDEECSLYVSDHGNHRVMKWMKDAKQGIVVAGGNGRGNSLAQLSSPQGVVVDRFGRIYVSDSDNARVMRWDRGSNEGTIVVGGNETGSQSNQLNEPFGLAFDQHDNLCVVDHKNHRIQHFEKE